MHSSTINISVLSLVILLSLMINRCLSDELSAPIIITSSSSSSPPSSSSSHSLSYPVGFYWSQEKYPNPLVDPYGCRQPKSSLLCDPDQILDPIEANEIRDLLEKYQNSNKCFCHQCPSGEAGIKVAIALARNINTDDSRHALNDASQQFADYLRNKWRYSLCNDSILLLMVQSYPVHKSSITTSLGRIAEHVFPHQFFSQLIYNHSMLMTTTSTTSTSSSSSSSYQADYSKNDDIGLGVVIGVHGDNHFQLLRSILMAINEHVEQIDDPSIYQQEDPITMLAAGSITDSNGGGSGSSSNSAVVVVAIIIGFIFFLTIVVGTVMLMKRRFEHEPDSELPDMDPPIGYETVSTNEPRKSLVPMAVVDDDDDDDNNNDDDDGHEQQQQRTTNVIDDDSNDDETSHILGDESQIRTPNDSPEQTR
ncbi:uncharacterized protein LOC124497767 [Dermatophagoides farinae]|uniref:uncharacterized protein LOC124497767 n=1 Tax=Dermatophagoides farinae TaxID=6954 RepID=UPI003F5E6191